MSGIGDYRGGSKEVQRGLEVSEKLSAGGSNDAICRKLGIKKDDSQVSLRSRVLQGTGLKRLTTVITKTALAASEGKGLFPKIGFTSDLFNRDKKIKFKSRVISTETGATKKRPASRRRRAGRAGFGRRARVMRASAGIKPGIGASAVPRSTRQVPAETPTRGADLSVDLSSSPPLGHPGALPAGISAVDLPDVVPLRTLPEGWAKATDASSGREYFYSSALRGKINELKDINGTTTTKLKTTWDFPTDADVESVNTDIAKVSTEITIQKIKEKEAKASAAEIQRENSIADAAKDLSSSPPLGHPGALPAGISAVDLPDVVPLRTLPEGWAKATDASSGREYFYSSALRGKINELKDINGTTTTKLKTTWDFPTDADVESVNTDIAKVSTEITIQKIKEKEAKASAAEIQRENSIADAAKTAGRNLFLTSTSGVHVTHAHTKLLEIPGLSDKAKEKIGKVKAQLAKAGNNRDELQKMAKFSQRFVHPDKTRGMDLKEIGLLKEYNNALSEYSNT